MRISKERGCLYSKNGIHNYTLKSELAKLVPNEQLFEKVLKDLKKHERKIISDGTLLYRHSSFRYSLERFKKDFALEFLLIDADNH